MESIVISSNELKQKNSVLISEIPFIKACDFAKSSFWHYTSLENANKILETENIYVSNLSSLNDVAERKLHGEESNKIHCFCLCNSDTEKIPLWYLYAGITGEGVAIKFTPSVLLKFIRSIDVVRTPDNAKELKRGIDFDLECGWVYYRKKESETQVMYRRQWYSVKGGTAEFSKDNYFVKDYPWEYEKEFRIVLKNKTEETFDKLVLDISPVIEELKLKTGPESTFKTSYKWNTGLKGIEKYLLKEIKGSSLDINMDLLGRNTNQFCDYYLQHPEKLSTECINKLKKICENHFD